MADTRVREDGLEVSSGTPKHWRRVTALVALVAAALALVLIQRPYLARERAGEQAVAISEQFIEAYGSWDPEAANLVSKTARISMNPARSPAELEMALAWLEATNWVFTGDGCTASRISLEEDTQRVLCYLRNENAWSRALGLDPDTRGAMTLEVFDGEITEVFQSFAPMSFPNEAVITFATWLMETHPEEEDVMYRLFGLPSLTPESIDLWREYTEEFVSEVDAGSR